MTFEQQWLEYDYNPFILFDANGKIISLNAEAQFLLGNASAQELFKLCTSYASVSFGFKTTFLELEPIDKELLETLRQTWMHSIRIVHHGSAVHIKNINERVAIS